MRVRIVLLCVLASTFAILTIAGCGPSAASKAPSGPFTYVGSWVCQHMSNSDILTITDNGDGTFHAMWQNTGGMGTTIGFGDATPDSSGLTFTLNDGSAALVLTPGDDASHMYCDYKYGTKDQFDYFQRQ